ncbi:hypothetical protein [Rhizobium sp. BK176]|uniref:hypothetical protein n=1 Tax=Rhizobium sp. BK176 TaxID=2587071 RepID=UPI002168CF7B|nr:hypothetical protein [Rhizobium sp. BK176]MCS4089090.1 hypothetical protein [Rhizobium sp. BK176]
MLISAHKIAILKAAEKKAFSETSGDQVAVKSAPWLDGDRKFGYVRPAEYRAGPFSVHLMDGGRESYATIDAMLDEWIGD